MFVKKCQSPSARQIGRDLLVRTAVVAIKTVVRFVQMHRHLGVGFGKGLHGIQAYPVVLFGIVRKNWAIGVTGNLFGVVDPPP